MIKSPGEIFSKLSLKNREFLPSILHILPLIYPIFNCVDLDPYSELGSAPIRILNVAECGSNLDPASQHCREVEPDRSTEIFFFASGGAEKILIPASIRESQDYLLLIL